MIWPVRAVNNPHRTRTAPAPHRTVPHRSAPFPHRLSSMRYFETTIDVIGFESAKKYMVYGFPELPYVSFFLILLRTPGSGTKLLTASPTFSVLWKGYASTNSLLTTGSRSH